MKKSVLLSILALLFILPANAQKIPLNSGSYDGWKSLSSPLISPSGNFISYTINPQEGDGWLYLINNFSGKKDSVECGTNLVFSPGEKYIAFQVIPRFLVTRQAKKKKLKEDKMPKNDLQIRLLGSDKIIKVERVKSFALPEKNSDWMAYLLEKKLKEQEPKKTMADTASATVNKYPGKGKKTEAKGTDLIIYNPLMNKEYKYEDVVEYAVAKDGRDICFVQDIADTTKEENYKVNVFDTGSEVTKLIFEGKGGLKKLGVGRTGEVIAFIYSPDTAKVKTYDLWLSKKTAPAVKVVDTTAKAMPKGWSVSENSNISFSDDLTKLYFGTAARPVREPEDTLIDDEKYRLDIWSWNDDVLQPMQKKQLEQEKKRFFTAVYRLDRNVMIQATDTSVPVVRFTKKQDNDIVIGISDLRYRRASSWEGDVAEDIYAIDLRNGNKSLLLKKCGSSISLSPDCKWIVYWNKDEKSWFSIPSAGGIAKNISRDINVPLYDELNDVPDDPSPHGICGWIDDSRHIIVYDRYDLWSIDVAGTTMPHNITNGFGRANNLRLRYSKTDPEEEALNTNKIWYLTAFNYENKESGFYSVKYGQSGDPSLLRMGKVSYQGNLIKAKNSDIFLWQCGSFVQSPELYTSNSGFQNIKQLSVTNPQQSKYIWGIAELVEWTSFDSKKLQGILYKPENFDPSLKYPMIVYFYERSSDGLYNYMPPAPSASIINRVFAVSNGYLVFVPDIPYVIGYPGQSCYNAVMSGTYSLLDRFSFIDRNRLALDGQSWGGYQIAYLVTRTDLFACAYAGAAVSDMISAYGGIRWGTGMSRMFQYEKTQSRIGGTLWEKPLQFIENSPIFWVPRIKTPLLLMHNDADDAVPWYQSIEFITALRRLGKPAWLLSYNDEAHNLTRRADKKDISIRKMQFFDHYLKNAPMPYWMKYGISQIEKGKINGYKLIDE